MREGVFEVSVFDAKTHNRLDEKEIEGIPYVISIPGQEYYVQVFVFRNNINQLWDYNFIRIGLYIDGFDVQYWKRLDFTDPSVSNVNVLHAKFWGFKENSNDFLSFVFKDPQVDYHDSYTPSNTQSTTITSSSSLNSSISNGVDLTHQIGQLKITIHEAILSDGMFENKCGEYRIPDTPKVVAKENQKFWMQPSVGTAAGGYITGKDQFKPIMKWVNKTTHPTQILTLKYHTQQTYDLMKKYSDQLKLGNTVISSSSSLLPSMDNTLSSSSHSSSNVLDGRGNKRFRYDSVTNTVDLTIEDDDDEVEEEAQWTDIHHGITNKSSGNTTEEIQEEITVIQVSKEVPLLDISDESSIPTWTSLTK